MIKKYYYLIIILVVCLIFSDTAKAYTSTVNQNISVNNGNTLILQTQSYTDLLPESTVQENDGLTTYANYSPTFNLMLQNTNQQYLNGWAIINCSIQILLSGGSSTFSFNGLEYIRPDSSNGLNVFVGTVTSNQFRIFVYFDNYYNQAGNSDLGQVKMNYTAAYGDISPMKASFTLTTTLTGSGINKTEGVINDRETELTYQAIWQATGQNFANILTFLNTISTQDYTFYTSLLNSLSQSNTFLQHIKNYTENISQRANTLNTNIETILIELESYIDFMEDFIPYLSNINTNTLNTYNQLVTIYNYIVSRQSMAFTLLNGYNVYTPNTGKTSINNKTNSTQKHILISRNENISYLYFYVNPTFESWANTTITYYENYNENSYQNIPTRTVKTNIEGWTYYTIDFKYNENFVVINVDNSEGKSNNLKLYIGGGYTYQALLYYIESMQNMNPQQSEAVADLESQYADKDNQSGDLLTGLGSLNMPSLSSDDLNILSTVDTNTKINFFGLIGLITNNGLITTILIIIVTGAIVGYALYGKK